MDENKETLDVQAPESDSTKNMVEWANPPSLSQLKGDLTDAQQRQSMQVTKISGWLDNLNVEGAAKVKGDGTSSTITPRLIRKQAEWRYPALSEPFLSTEDVFNVKPVTFEDQKAADQNELLLNHQFNCLMNKQTLIDSIVRTAVDEGTVIARIGWFSREEEVEEEVPEVEFTEDQTFLEELQGYMQMQEQSPSDFLRLDPVMQRAVEISMEMQMPMRPNIIGMTTQKRMKTVENRPTVEICDYRNVTFDPTCLGDVDKARFVVHSFETSLDALRKDGRYVNLDKINIENASILGDPDHSTNGGSQSFNFTDNARKKFVVYEYWGDWDINGDGVTVPIVAAWCGNTVIRLEENPFPDRKHPFLVCQYLPVRRSVYGEPDGALLEDNQKVAGAVMRGILDIIGKSANGQMGIRKDMLDVTNKRLFDQGKDYMFNPQVDPRQGMFMHTYSEVPGSAQWLLSQQQLEAESMTGVKAFDQGINASSMGDVAAGIRGAMDAASKRELGILRRLSTFMCAIARKIIAMNSVFLTEPEVVRLTNEHFVTIDPDDLPGNFDLKVTVSTAEEDNNKASEISFMLQTMGNTIPMPVTQMLLGKLFKLRKMPDLAKTIETFQPEPDPIAEEQRMLELELMRAEVQEKIADIQKRTAESQLALAKVQTEIQKAQNIKSVTDQNTLDFVEQESGVKQERDLQKQGEQARAQTEMKIIDNQMRDQQEDKKFAQSIVMEQTKANLSKFVSKE